MTTLGIIAIMVNNRLAHAKSSLSLGNSNDDRACPVPLGDPWWEISYGWAFWSESTENRAALVLIWQEWNN